MSKKSRDTAAAIPAHLASRLRTLESQLAQLLTAPYIRFDDRCRSLLPEGHGIYRIFDPRAADETLRAGRTKTAAGGLRQRVYQNHLMGDQAGNLRAQLVAGGLCVDAAAAKQFMREHLVVQVLAVENVEDRAWLEYVMLAVLRPRYCD